MWPRKEFQALSDFQGILCKMESEVGNVIIWTNFDSFANT